MTETKCYFIDVINLVPDNSICFIQAPCIEASSTLNNLLLPSEFEYYQQINLSPSNKEKIGEIIKAEDVVADFQGIEIRHNGKLYFKGYDGMVFGNISKDVKLPENFIKDFVESDMCNVAVEW